MSARIEALQAKRDILNAKIQQEASRPYPDSLRVQLLKRQRLRLKDKMVQESRRTDRLVGQQL
jgi:hypothetical protein